MGDGQSDLVTFTNGLNEPAGPNFAYLITDDNEILQELVTAGSFDFESAPANYTRVYGLHFSGGLTVGLGQVRTQTTAADCHTHSSGFVSIQNTACPPAFECLASEVSSGGQSVVDVCSSDGTADILLFENSLGVVNSQNYVYLVTDQNEILQEVIFNGGFDFEGSGNQTQRVYGLHYDGVLVPATGQPRSQTTATGCAEHSSTFVTITKNGCSPVFQCNASTVSSGGQQAVDLCPTDGVSDPVTFQNNLGAAVGQNYAYLITDQNEVLQDVVLSTSYDFEGSGIISQRVYGIHFDGDLNPAIGQDRRNTTATGCFVHSSSFVSVTKNGCQPAFQCRLSTVSTGGQQAIDVCPTDGISNPVTFQNSLNATVGQNYAYLITDQNEILQEVVLSSSYDFEGSGITTQRVYGLHYDGTLDIALGQNRRNTTASGCFAHTGFSDFVSVTKTACPPEFTCRLSTLSASGQQAVDLCPSDNISSPVTFQNSLNATVGQNYAYLITDQNEILQEVVLGSTYDFEGSGPATQRVYGMHYDGDLDIAIGQNRRNTSASGCFAHTGSTDFVSITKAACPPAFVCRVSTVNTGGSRSIDLCPSDNVSDPVTFQNSLNATVGQNYAYLITDENEILQEVVLSSTYDFEGSGEAVQRVYGDAL